MSNLLLDDEDTISIQQAVENIIIDSQSTAAAAVAITQFFQNILTKIEKLNGGKTKNIL